MTQVITGDEIVDIQPWILPEITHHKDNDQRNEGSHAEEIAFRAGYQKGLDCAKKIAKNELKDECQNELQQELQRKISLLNEMIVQLQKPLTQVSEDIENEIFKLIEKMLEKLVRREFKLHPEKLRTVVVQALQLLPIENNDVILFLSSEDFVELTPFLADVVNYFQIDESLHSGDFKLSVKDSLVDGSIQRRVENLISHTRDQQQLPTAHSLGVVDE